MASVRNDLDEQAAAFYGCDVPPLAAGDRIDLPEHGGSFVVDGFASGGMLVDVIRVGDAHPFCLPRRYTPRHGEPFFLAAAK